MKLTPNHSGAGLEARDTADSEVWATRQEGLIVIIAPDGGNKKG